MSNLQYLIPALVLLLALDYFSAATRSAYLHTSHARLLTLREQREADVNRASALLLSLSRLQVSLNFVLVLVHFFLAGLIVSVVAEQSFRHPYAVGAGALLVGGILLFWFEALITKVVTQDPETYALNMAPYGRIVMGLAAVFTVPTGLVKEVQSAGEVLVTVTEDELKTLVDAGEEEGVFEQGERRMIYSIFNLADTLAREIMVPRIDLTALDVKTPLPEAIDALLKSGHSRLPVFDDTVDNTLGLLYAKDLLRVWREGGQIESLRPLLRPAYFIPEAKKVDELLAEMQSRRVHMAIVVDEYGGVAGLVTLEDIVEEILGEIRDEYDQAEELPYLRLKDGDYIFQGRVDLDNFNEVMESSLSKDEADTIGGFMYSHIGRVPDVGDVVHQGNLELIVEQVSGRRIRKVRAHQVPAEMPGSEGTDADHR